MRTVTFETNTADTELPVMVTAEISSFMYEGTWRNSEVYEEAEITSIEHMDQSGELSEDLYTKHDLAIWREQALEY